MKFDMKNIHTIFESAKSKNCVPSEHADKEGAKIDATLGSSDLNELFDNICPICGDVFASMKSAAADPKNLKITMTKTQDLGESAHIYIEAVEFATFCEAAELEINEAADAIKSTCEEMVPGSQDSELHVVFPSECLNNGNLGSNRFGLDVNNDWAMQLMRGCRRYGISVNSGVEDGEPVTESAYKKAESEAINEGFGRHVFRDVKPLRDDKDGDKDDKKVTTRPDGSKWQNSIDLPDDNGGWIDSINLDESAYKKVMNEAASKKPLGYEACIKRDKALIEREVNTASKEAYKIFKDDFSDYYYKKYIDEFYKDNKTAPKFDGLTYESGLYAIELNTNAYFDICLFYQDRVCNLLNKSEKLKALGYKFNTEDDLGIFIRNASAEAIK